MNAGPNTAPDLPAARSASFDWPIYADATFAGLSVLIPIPILDWLFEQFFRRRMVATIARRRGRPVPPDVRRQLNPSRQGCMAGCLSLGLTGIIALVKRTSRKILYVLTIKDATDQLSFYWQRAFLIDRMLELGHLDSPATAAIAGQAMDQVLAASAGPMRQLAQQVIMGTRHVFGTLLRARRGREDEVVQQAKSRMSSGWAGFEGALAALAIRYDQAYQQLLAAQRPTE